MRSLMTALTDTERSVSRPHRYVLIDTSVFILIEEGYDVLEGIVHDLGDSYLCMTTDSVLRELLIWAAKRTGDLVLRYIEKISEKCLVVTVSEDLEREDADHDLIRVAVATRTPVVTLDRELKRELKRLGLHYLVYRGPEKRIEEV